MGFWNRLGATAAGAAAGMLTPFGVGIIPGAIAGYTLSDPGNPKPRNMAPEQQAALMESRGNALDTQRQRQQDLLNAYQGNVKNFQAAIPQGEAAIRANIARRMSSTMAGVPVGSGAGLAAAGQSGYDADMAAGQFGLGAAEQLGRAQTDYATAAYEASLPENRVMTPEEQKQKLTSDFDTALQTAVKNNTDLLGVDEEDVYADMVRYIEAEPDPALRKEMMRRLDQWMDRENWSI